MHTATAMNTTNVETDVPLVPLSEDQMKSLAKLIYRYSGVVGGGDLVFTDTFRERYNLDSLDVVELCMDVEDEFGIEIPFDKGEDILTVQQLHDFIANALMAKPGAA